MEEIQKNYNLTVKHNLRAFLLTAEYKIDQWVIAMEFGYDAEWILHGDK